MFHNLAGFARHTTRLWLVAAMALALALGTVTLAPPASAAPATQPVAAAMTYHPSATHSPLTAGIPVLTAWSDCRKAAAGVPHPAAKVAKALSAWKCGATVINAAGNFNAAHICWGSQQWWGAPYRWLVSMITGGQYTKC